MMNHEKFDELKDAYALGALPEEELREFEEYLAAHPEHQSEVDELNSIAALLAVSPADQEPPKRLKRSVMAMVKAETANSRRERRMTSSSSWRASLDNLRDMFPARIALGAAAMVVVALLAWNVALQSEVRELDGVNGELQAEIEDARAGDAGAQIFAMRGEGEMSDANAEVISLEDENRTIFVAENVPSLPEGRTFQIWVIDAEGAKPSGVFQPNGDSAAMVVTEPIEGAETIAVTVEPAGGSPQPTTDPMLSVQL